MTPPPPELQQLLTFSQGFESVWLGVLAMGFIYGLTLCSLTCIPLITPYIFATQPGFRRGFDATAIFILARITAYTLWGAIAGLLGDVLLTRLDHQWPGLLAGGLIMLIALRVIWKGRSACPGHRADGRSIKPPTRQSWWQMATLGFSTSLLPCPPLSGVLIYAATTQSMFSGALLALLFGIGAAASPLYYIGGTTGWFAQHLFKQIPRHGHWLRLLSGTILGVFGIRLLLMNGIMG
jgi:sulfite exporter TauE/SafE